MSLNLNKYLNLLRKEASRYERTDINNKIDDSFKAKYLVKLIFLTIAITCFFLLKTGFSQNFVSFVSSVLSILVGLFITALIFSFDKFYEPTNTEYANSRIKLWEKQAYNYAKKFAYITSYTIVISIFTLIFLAVSALFETGSTIDVFKLQFCFECLNGEKIYKAVKLFLLGSFAFIQRILVIYWLLKVVYNTLFIVSSMVQYMTTKIDRN